MQNYHTIKSLETQEKLRRQYEPILRQMKIIEEFNRHQELMRTIDSLKRYRELVHTDLDSIRRYQELMRAACGPLEDIRRNISLAQVSQSQLGGEFIQMRDQMLAIEKQFHLPEISEAAKLLHERANSLSNVVDQYWKQESEFRRGIESAVKSINTPWLDTVNEMNSINGFARLQGIGNALRTMPTFDYNLAAQLRVDLGDWREKIIYPPQIFTDPLTRNSFYEERGFNPDLTTFPNNAFEQIVTTAGLREIIPLDDAYDFELKLEEIEREADLKRTNKAHDVLQRFETQMRKFIEEQMTEAFGPTWIKHRIDGQMRKQWLEKQEKAEANGEREWPLIAYADFTDYVKIITQKNNWEEVFKDFFDRKESVQESFQRLYPIRLCTMHARIITQDDEIYLYVETKRILGAIRS